MKIDVLLSVNIVVLITALLTILYWGVRIGKLVGQISEKVTDLNIANAQLWEKKQDVAVCNAKHERLTVLQGIPGIPGQQGIQGNRGRQGEQGERGEHG